MLVLVLSFVVVCVPSRCWWMLVLVFSVIIGVEVIALYFLVLLSSSPYFDLVENVTAGRTGSAGTCGP